MIKDIQQVNILPYANTQPTLFGYIFYLGIPYLCTNSGFIRVHEEIKISAVISSMSSKHEELVSLALTLEMSKIVISSITQNQTC